MASILVIDDNEKFRAMLCEILESEGYETIPASDGKKGIAIYRTKPTDLIITDVNMPEKSGPELIFELQKEFPTVKIIAISGGTENSEQYLNDIKAFSNIKYVFLKPFDIDELLLAVKEFVSE